LISHEVIVNLIASTTTQTGLKIEAEIDTNLYPKGLRVTDEELEKINIQKANFHGEWNYTILRQPESCYSYIWTGSKCWVQHCDCPCKNPFREMRRYAANIWPVSSAPA